MFLSCHICVLERIYTLQLPESQETFYIQGNLPAWLKSCLSEMLQYGQELLLPSLDNVIMLHIFTESTQT